LVQAPASEWQAAACNLGLLVALLQSCAAVLHQAGLQRSSDQLQRLLQAFLKQQEGRSPLGLQPPPRRPAVSAVPTRRRESPSRRVPGLGRLQPPSASS
jgi:hypothetical protein